MDGKTVLIVDDDPDTVRLLGRILQQAGYQVLIAFDAAQAVMEAHRRQPALILTDLMMPVGGGLSVLERLRMSIRTHRIPVIVLTASEDPDVEAQAYAQGAAAFLRKPWNAEALLDAIRKAVGSVA